MRKFFLAITFLHTCYIVFISFAFLVTLFGRPLRVFFHNDFSFMIHNAVGCFIIIMAGMICYAQFKKMEKLHIYQMAWWMPQLFVIGIHTVTKGGVPSDTYLYFLPYPSTVPLPSWWEIGNGTILMVAINLIPVVGVLAGYLTMKGTFRNTANREAGHVQESQ